MQAGDCLTRVPKAGLGFAAFPVSLSVTWTEQQARLQSLFPWLKFSLISAGDYQIAVWFRSSVDMNWIEQDGYVYVLAGSPITQSTWADLVRCTREGGSFPLEGRFSLLRVCCSDKRVDMWNDWCGSVPVFYSCLSGQWVLSTLEDYLVRLGQWSSDNFSQRGLVALLSSGHYWGTDTLFQSMKVLAADSHAVLTSDGQEKIERMWTIDPSSVAVPDKRHLRLEKLYELTYQAIENSFAKDESYILPLSGGLDSRLIACVAADAKVNARAITYGHEQWREVVYAREVCDVLRIPWERLDLGKHFLKDHTEYWLDWFGSSMHAHGMYQIPFLEQVKNQGVINTGFTGDPVGGLQTAGMKESFEKHQAWLPYFTEKSQMMSRSLVQKLVSFNIDSAWHSQEAYLQQQYESMRGEEWQKRWFLFQWNHVAPFSYYQPMMYDYFNGVSTPFMDKRLVAYCLSLPLEDMLERSLQQDMIKRYWPKAAAVKGTFHRSTSKERLMKHFKSSVRKVVPWKWLTSIAGKAGYQANTMQIEALMTDGVEALYPLQDLGAAGNYFKGDAVRALMDRALTYDPAALYALHCVQPIVYRIQQRVMT